MQQPPSPDVAREIRREVLECEIHATQLTDRMADTIEQKRVNYRDSPVVTGTGHTLRAALT